MIRRAFVRALSGAILTTLLGVKPWRLEEGSPIAKWSVVWTPELVSFCVAHRECGDGFADADYDLTPEGEEVCYARCLPCDVRHPEPVQQTFT